jgi:hypothetical protein
MSTRGDQTCLDYSIDHQTDIDYSIEHQTSVVYSMDTSNLCCLQYWHIKLWIHITNLKPFKSSDLYGVVYKVIKIKFEQFHSYQYNLQAFEKHRSLLSTFSMLRYLINTTQVIVRHRICLQTDGRTWWNQYNPLQLHCEGYKNRLIQAFCKSSNWYRFRENIPSTMIKSSYDNVRHY